MNKKMTVTILRTHYNDSIIGMVSGVGEDTIYETDSDNLEVTYQVSIKDDANTQRYHDTVRVREDADMDMIKEAILQRIDKMRYNELVGLRFEMEID